MYINTEDIDCDVCKGDLHLWAVVSPTCPERATCPEHVSALECPTETMRLLYRYPHNSQAVPDLPHMRMFCKELAQLHKDLVLS